jgi:hypothetical protein
MVEKFELVTATDKPALLALSTPELQETARTALEQLGYKVHSAVSHGEFLYKFAQIPYQVVIMEEQFSCAESDQNESLIALQRMPMSLRRHAVVILFGVDLATFNPLQAFQHSVHAVVNPAEMFLLTQLIQKAVCDNEIFLQPYREVQKAIVV